MDPKPQSYILWLLNNRTKAFIIWMRTKEHLQRTAWSHTGATCLHSKNKANSTEQLLGSPWAPSPHTRGHATQCRAKLLQRQSQQCDRPPLHRQLFLHFLPPTPKRRHQGWCPNHHPPPPLVMLQPHTCLLMKKMRRAIFTPSCASSSWVPQL